MKVYAILLLFVHKIFANDKEVFNVGTVLFSSDELKKVDWSVTDVGLLRARRYFQYVLPHPFLVDPSIDHFADLILGYFTNAVNVVKREKTDPVLTDLLTTAISDAIGGYMKSYVLPVTKYGYYGGTISKDDAQKLYQFYDDIKTYLKTDGSGWRSFDGKFQKPLNFIATIPLDHYIRVTRQSCDQLAFYEESPSGFTIPLPSIKFDSNSMMFVPLKGHPLICLHSPDSSDTLLNYYHAAKNCLKTRSRNDVAEFDNRFRAWLTDDVIAHLDDDDHLYYALGGILTLATDLKDLEFPVSSKKLKPVSRVKPYIHINFGSKKVMILSLILFLEIIWCIPALLYMLYKRIKKKKESSDMLLFVNPNKDKDYNFLSTSGMQTRSISSCDENACESIKKFKKTCIQTNDTRNPCKNCFIQSGHGVESQTPVFSKRSKGTSSRPFFRSTKKCSTKSYLIENECLQTKLTQSGSKNTSAPIFDEKSSHFAKSRLFESHNVKIKSKSSIQNAAVKFPDNNKLPLQGDTTGKTKSRKSKENILSKSIESAINIRQSFDEQGVIQIESCNNVGWLYRSNNSIKNQQSLNEMSDLGKSSVDTLTQGKTYIDATIFQESKNKVNISHKASEEGNVLREPGNSAVIAENTQNTLVRKSKENTLHKHKSHDNTINLHPSLTYAVVLRESDDDARTQQKSIQEVLNPRKSKHNLLILNKSNDNLRKESKSGDTAMTIKNLKNEVAYFDSQNYSEEHSHVNDEDSINPIHDVTTTLGQSVEENYLFGEPNNTLKIIENLDQKAKILQKSTNKLMQMIDARRDTCGNPNCDCICCQSQKNNESYTEMQKLKTCATITLIPDDDSSEKSAQNKKTVCKKHQETETNLLVNASRPVINTYTSVQSMKQTKPVIDARCSALNSILKPLKLNTADTKCSTEEKIKDKNTEREKWSDKKEENDDLRKRKQKKVEIKNEEKVDGKAKNRKQMYGFKFTGGNKALFEVKIEKPHTSISVGIAKGNPQGPKTSRIPTRIRRDNLVRYNDRVSVYLRRPLEASMGSKIPLPVKRTTDDIVIRHSRNKGSTPDPRLNITL